MNRTGAAPLGAPAEDRTALARQQLTRRLAIGLLLDTIGIARGDGNILDTLLAAAIIQANVQEIIRRADLQLAFSEKDEIPPDELRRPVTMNAVANSLQLPFETVRRRVRAMAESGFCRFVDGGVIVPTAVLTSPQYYVDAYRGYERIRAGYYELSGLGLLRDLPQPTVDLASGVFPVRAVARVMGTYLLRVVETLAPIGDLLDGVIWLELYRANIEALPHGAAAGEGLDGAEHDGLRKPIAVTALAGRIGVPQETVRRHVTGLMARGFCKRLPGGLIVTAEQLARPELAAVLTDNAANLQRMFSALAQLGVLQAWDAIRPDA